MTRTRILLATLALLAVGCAGTASLTPQAAGATFIVVRHAEKATAADDDPGLAPAGRERAARLARMFEDANLVAVYATGYRRTRDTVQPAARRHALEPQTYDARVAAGAFAAQLAARHRTGTVLVAGHSNTVPDIVAALCACATAAMDEDEYDRISIVRFDAAGRPALEIARY
ncbi:MAG TPA: histidine phosphatase family protein [Luteimonas sp.]|nr:histidine phosphatase family protein [Luteimonas sp.]